MVGRYLSFSRVYDGMIMEYALIPLLRSVFASSVVVHLIFRAGNFVFRSLRTSSIETLFLSIISILISSGVCVVKWEPILKASRVRAARDWGVSTS